MSYETRPLEKRAMMQKLKRGARFELPAEEQTVTAPALVFAK
jgi:hypothetical protein